MFNDIMFRNRAEHRNYKLIMVAVAVIFIFYYLNFLPNFSATNHSGDGGANGRFFYTDERSMKTCKTKDNAHLQQSETCKYVYRYPLSPVQETSGGTSYRIAIIADLDAQRSRVPNEKYYDYQSTYISLIQSVQKSIHRSNFLRINISMNTEA